MKYTRRNETPRLASLLLLMEMMMNNGAEDELPEARASLTRVSEKRDRLHNDTLTANERADRFFAQSQPFPLDSAIYVLYLKESHMRYMNMNNLSKL